MKPDRETELPLARSKEWTVRKNVAVSLAFFLPAKAAFRQLAAMLDDDTAVIAAAAEGLAAHGGQVPAFDSTAQQATWPPERARALPHHRGPAPRTCP